MVGIDVSKGQLDVAFRPSGKRLAVAEHELARPFRAPASGAASPICERGAALTSHLQPFETDLLTQADNRYRRLPPLTADIGGWYSVGFRRSTN